MIDKKIKNKEKSLTLIRTSTHFLGRHKIEFYKNEDKLITFISNNIIPLLKKIKSRKYRLNGKNINLEKEKIDNLLKFLTSKKFIDQKYKDAGIYNDVELYLFIKSKQNTSDDTIKKIKEEYSYFFTGNSNNFTDHLINSIGHIENGIEGSLRNLRAIKKERKIGFKYNTMSRYLTIAVIATVIWYITAGDNYPNFLNQMKDYSPLATFIGLALQLVTINKKKYSKTS